MALRRSLALEVAAFLAWNSIPAPPIVLGVVVEANRGHLNAGAVSAGATVYDGDYFSTETGGMLLLRGNAVMLELAEESAVIVRSRANGAQGTEAELSKGTLVFTTTRAAALEIAAREARIRPIADARTIAQVSLTGTKELRIYARRESLEFSYRGETETIAEGAAYRVILDPPEGDAGKKQTVKSGRRRKAFLLIAIGAGTAGAAVSIHGRHHDEGVESPDRP
jgi:hypothetical protein